MRKLKFNNILSSVNNYLVDSGQPLNLSYLWNFGSLLGFCLIIQIVTGVTLAMHYDPNVLEAFNSLEHIMRDVNKGWLIRYLHSNTASAFFLFVYIHIGRGMYYGSYKTPRKLVWAIGTVMLILMMATAFLGYDYSPIWFDLDFCGFYLFVFNSTMQLDTTTKKKEIKYCVKRYGVCNKVFKRHYTTSVNSLRDSTVSKQLKLFIKELGLSPLYTYENIGNQDTRKQICKDMKGLSGIYMIVNKITKDYYIGSASTNRFFPRFCSHLINLSGSKIVKLALRKYKINNFAFIILELYPNIVTKENNKELIDLEDRYLKLLLPNYNILTEAGSSFGYKHTEIDRQKMKDNYSEARREAIGNLDKGKKLSPETVEKMRVIALNRPSMVVGTREKCITNTRPVILYNLDRTIFGKYDTITDAANAIGCGVKTIGKALKTEKKLVKRQWIVNDISNSLKTTSSSVRDIVDRSKFPPNTILLSFLLLLCTVAYASSKAMEMENEISDSYS